MSMRRLHARGVRLVRGIDYSELLKVPYAEQRLQKQNLMLMRKSC